MSGIKKITKLTGPKKNITTRGLTVRVPEDIVEGLEKITSTYYQTISNIVRNQLIKFLRWDIFEAKIKLIPIPMTMIDIMVKDKSDEDLEKLASHMFEVLKEWTILSKEEWGLNQCIEALEDYLNISNIDATHKKILNEHTFEIKHNMHEKCSIFGMNLFQHILKEFSKPNAEYNFSPGVLGIKIELGQEFNEHVY